jgi:transposase-like protein
MSSQRYTPEFKDEAVRQVVERGLHRRVCGTEEGGCLRPEDRFLWSQEVDLSMS